MFILIKVSGSKLWRFRFQFAGKDQEMALGKYPSIPLSEARKLTQEANTLLMQGINPMAQRKERKRSNTDESKCFETISLKWWELQKLDWSDDNVSKIYRWLTVDCQRIGKLDINSIDAAHIAELMLAIEAAGHPKKCRPILSVINRVYCYAFVHGFKGQNPAQGLSLKDILKPIPKVKHMSAITERSQLAKLIKTIDENESGSFCGKEALKLLPRLLLRPGEVRLLQ